MGLMLKQQRNGVLRPQWYGVYTVAGARKVLNLDVPVQGTPPESLSLRKTGDRDFERSREKAEEALARYVAEASHKGRSEHLTERLIESKTGRAVDYARIGDLPSLWRNLGRETPASEDYLKGSDAVFNRFVAFMRTRNPAAVHLYEISPKDAAAYVTAIQSALARKTVRDAVKMLNKALARFLPVGAVNPFASFVGRRASGESETVHRKPFTPDELQALLNAARDDEFMYPLIMAAACTGMRRGDVCNLCWSAVDWKEGMLKVKTSKTEAEVEIPIFRPLLAVLKKRKGNGSKYVFPDAARMLAQSPDSLTWRFKKLVVAVFSGRESPALPAAIPVAEVKPAGESAITAKVSPGERRDRMLAVFRRYCAKESVRQITKATGYAKATVSGDLHAIQDLIGKPFLRVQCPSIKAAVRRVTQTTREHGQRAASVRDWHALRSTFVTLALAAGVPVELVRRVTGHATVEIVLKHYFRPGRAEFKAALTGAMPAVLTGGKPKRLKPADELAALSGKLVAGTATDEDKSRLRKLAAAV